MSHPQPLLTVDETANLLKISPHTLNSWRRAGATGGGLPWVLVGGQVRYRPEDVEAWLSSRTKGAA